MVAKKSIKTNIHQEGNKKEESNIWEKLSIKERGEEMKGFLKWFKSLFRYAINVIIIPNNYWFVNVIGLSFLGSTLRTKI